VSLAVLTYATQETHAMRRAMESFRRIGGVEPVVVGMGDTHSWQGRIAALYAWCLEHPAASVLCVDAYDTCCVRSLYGLLCGGLTFSAEANCWPDQERANDYKPCDTRYRYVNAGVWFGEGGAYCQLVEARGLLAGVTDDQRAYTAAHLAGEPFAVDHRCHIAHNRYLAEDDWEIRDGIYWVKSTGTAPLVVHGNGGSSIDVVWEAFGV
jgi:hypothetical protein